MCFLVVELSTSSFLVLLLFLFSGIFFSFIFELCSAFLCCCFVFIFRSVFGFLIFFLIVLGFCRMGVLSSVWCVMPYRFVFCFSCWVFLLFTTLFLFPARVCFFVLSPSPALDSLSAAWWSLAVDHHGDWGIEKANWKLCRQDFLDLCLCCSDLFGWCFLWEDPGLWHWSVDPVSYMDGQWG